MHLLQIPSWYPHPDGSGGGTFFREQALALRVAGVDAGVCYGELDWRQPLHPRVDYHFDRGLPTLRYRVCAPPKANRLLMRYWQRQYLSAYRAYVERRGRPDLIHAHSLVAGLAAAGIQAAEGIPYVFTAHLGSLTLPDVPPRIKLLGRFGLYHARQVIAVSAGLGRALQQHWPGLEFQVIPNGVDTNFFRPASASRPKRPFTVLSIGDPVHTKGLDILLRAAGQFRRKFSGLTFQIWLADDIPRRRQLIPILEQEGLTQHVHFLGRTSRAETRHCLQAADVLVSASRFESFGLTMAEALACGTPVLATRTAGALDIVQAGTGLLVPTENVAAMAAALEKIYLSAVRFEPERLRRSALERFAWPIVTAQLVEIYRRHAR